MNSTHPRARRVLVRIATTAVLAVVPMAAVSVSALAEAPATSGIQLDNVDRPGKGRSDNGHHRDGGINNGRHNRNRHDHGLRGNNRHDHSDWNNGRPGRNRPGVHDHGRHDHSWNRGPDRHGWNGRHDHDRGRHDHHYNPPRHLPPAPHLLPPPPPPILLPPLVLPFPLPGTGSAF